MTGSYKSVVVWTVVWIVISTYCGAQFTYEVTNEIDKGDRRLRCYSCSTVNGSHIVAGTGVDPGVFLSTIPLGSLPVTHRCADPYDSNSAIRAGVVSSVCEDGLCVKINYTDKWTNADGEVIQKCYSCTTPDAEASLRDVKDKDWQRWLASVRGVPRSPSCADPFEPEMAVRAGTFLEECEKGICMKLWYKEKNGKPQIWRTCIPNAQGVVKADCTKISSTEGDMEVCTCDGQSCNGATSSRRPCLAANYLTHILVTSALFMFAYQFFLINYY